MTLVEDVRGRHVALDRGGRGDGRREHRAGPDTVGEARDGDGSGDLSEQHAGQQRTINLGGMCLELSSEELLLDIVDVLVVLYTLLPHPVPITVLLGPLLSAQGTDQPTRIPIGGLLGIARVNDRQQQGSPTSQLRVLAWKGKAAQSNTQRKIR